MFMIRAPPIRAPPRRLRPRESAPSPMETMRSEVEKRLGKTTTAPSEDRIKAQHHRIQRDLLLYETCSSEELLLFCQQRGINLPTRSHRITRRARDELIKLLETADEVFTFHKYVDLPPELCLLVIEAYMSSAPRPSIDNSPPPICGVSRNVRHDSLNILYQNYRLDLSFDLRRVSPELNLQFRCGTVQLPASEVEYIKKYSITGTFFLSSHSTFTLDISKDGKDYQLSETSRPVWNRQRRVAANMLGRMKASLHGMLFGNGKIVLSASEIWAWREMWEMALKDVEDEERTMWIGIHHPLAGPPLPSGR